MRRYRPVAAGDLQLYDTPFDMLALSPFGAVVAALWGALWGSFFNVVIERLPRGESLLRPGSHCMVCHEPVRLYDNVPILSYLVLRGRCRHCGAAFSARYMLVELLGLGLALACYYHAARSGVGPVELRLANFLVEFFFVGGMIVIAFIDIRTMIIPSVVTYPLVVCLAAATIALGRLRWFDSLAGASAGFLFVFLVAEVYRLLRGHEGLGLGDGKLLAVVGGFLGWKSLPLVLLLGSVQGLLVALPTVLLGRSLMARHSYHGLTDQEPAEETVLSKEDPDRPISSDPEKHNPSTVGERGTTEPDSEGPQEADHSTAQADGEQAEAVDQPLPPGLEDLRPDAVPFGPFLALAGVEVLFAGEWLVARVSAVLDQLFRLL